MKKLNSDAVKIIPLGGLEQIGMNITAIEYEDSIIVIDCGERGVVDLTHMNRELLAKCSCYP